MQFLISPTNEDRQQQWEKVYGRSQLPIKYPYPHIACTQRWGDVPVYYLDTTAVPNALLDRLATFEARRMGIPYDDARLAVRREWLIKAEGCKVEKAANSGKISWQPAFAFLNQVPLQPKYGKMRLGRMV